jgi:hypothetical protein
MSSVIASDLVRQTVEGRGSEHFQRLGACRRKDAMQGDASSICAKSIVVVPIQPGSHITCLISPSLRLSAVQFSPPLVLR